MCRKREEGRGADRGEVRRTGGEPATRMQQVDMQSGARPSPQREQETDHLLTHKAQRGQRVNVESVYTLIQSQ